MKFIIMILCAMVLSTAQAQVPPPEDGSPSQLLLNMQVPCSANGVDYIADMVNKHKEQEFASGTFYIKPLNRPSLEEVDLLMYVNPKSKTFSIFSLQTVGEYEVACIIAGGTGFAPFTGEYRADER